jgi:hypothetical protein
MIGDCNSDVDTSQAVEPMTVFPEVMAEALATSVSRA